MWSRFFDLLNYMVYDLKSFVDLWWLLMSGAIFILRWSCYYQECEFSVKEIFVSDYNEFGNTLWVWWVRSYLVSTVPKSSSACSSSSTCLRNLWEKKVGNFPLHEKRLLSVKGHIKWKKRKKVDIFQNSISDHYWTKLGRLKPFFAFQGPIGTVGGQFWVF